ncbi:hypothetical protein FJ976_06110 [Mesorhizobium sp. B1-1-9]|nr:hypothetical protein [Mesorhizobium sp. B1-1-9]TPN56599.1 hypothetical protein FJ976_06110 [Mesorhizobium sp. B1-1-9]
MLEVKNNAPFGSAFSLFRPLLRVTIVRAAGTIPIGAPLIFTIPRRRPQAAQPKKGHVMNPLLPLDTLAAPRGDGLHPKLARLLRSHLILGVPGVVVLGQAQGDGLVQAGPHPVGNVDEASQKGVLRFPERP